MMCHRIFLRRASAAAGRGRTCVGAATAPSPHGSDTAGPQPMSMYGKERNALGSILSDVLSGMPAAPRYFLDNGTLLGLWRNGALIDKDDDFDFGVLVNKSEFSKTWVGEFQDAVQQGLDQHHELHSGGEGGVGVARYQSRVVGSYADKIEVFDASMGSYPLAGEKYHGARYHHVSCDLQMHVMDDVVVEANAKIPDAEKERQGGGDGGGEEVGDAAALAAATAAAAILIVEETVVTGKGVKIHHSDFATRGKAPGDVYEPFGHVTYNGKSWPVPQQTKAYLSYLYGYLGLGAEMDEFTKLYRLALEPQVAARPLRLYTDMCADLFHTGHVNYLRQCRGVHDNVHLVVGIHSDATIESYKRASVCTMDERVGVVRACKYVDDVLPNAPLRVTKEFMVDNDIDFVIHGTETPEEERQAMYSIPIGLGRYTEVPRTGGISTTQLIDRIASRLAVEYEEHAIPSERQPVVTVVQEISNKRD